VRHQSHSAHLFIISKLQGSWGGIGLRKAPPKPQRIKQIAGIDPTTRADYNKKHIIISEKRDKKAGKYLVKDLPFPFTSKAQFERSMERPLGAEWNTRVGFQKGTLPRVMKKVRWLVHRARCKTDSYFLTIAWCYHQPTGKTRLSCLIFS